MMNAGSSTAPATPPFAPCRSLRCTCGWCEHIARGVAPDEWLFRAARGVRLTSNEYCAVWDAAREAVLTLAEVKSEMADVPYCLRHAAVSLWSGDHRKLASTGSSKASEHWRAKQRAFTIARRAETRHSRQDMVDSLEKTGSSRPR